MGMSTLNLVVSSILLLQWQTSAAFAPRLSLKQTWRRSRLLRATTAEGSSNNMDDLRRLMEAAWNVETMGRVPTSAAGAAEASVVALKTALERNKEFTTSRIFFIDILLPQYDITAGNNLYDEVLAVEFCIALANLLQVKTEILVRDAKVLQTVNRIFNAREGTSNGNVAKRVEPKIPKPEFFDDSADVGANPARTDALTTATNSKSKDPPLTENLSTASETDDRSPKDSNSDVEGFRQLLLLSWEATVDLDAVREEELLNDEDDDDDDDDEEEEEPIVEDAAQERSEKRHRVASLLGDATISKGPDMIDDVMAAVSANALPMEDEEAIVILSAITKEELYAVRAVAAKYGSSKTVILVNCKLDPIPQELTGAETVYSILPLIARRNSNSGSNAAAPRVVVLRRFPRDWEVYVDTGKGFDLAASVAAGTAFRRGPSMEWISSAVKRYMQNNPR